MKQNIFDKFNNWINDTEGSLVNFLTAFSPWLAPLIPAYMTFHHMIKFLLFDEWLAWVLAGVVEILGFGTVSTGLDFWFYNRRNKRKDKKAPLALVVLSFSFYLALIVLSNVILDVAGAFGTEVQQAWSIISVRFLLTLQTLPAALIVATRTGHRELLAEIKREKAEKDTKLSESYAKVSESSTLPEEAKVRDWRKLRPTLTETDLHNLAYLSPSQVQATATKFGVTSRTVENWRNNARVELGVD
jgi:hypothetical protein